MNKQKLIKKLAALYGIRLDYIDFSGKLHKLSFKECEEFLNVLGINTENLENIEREINKIELHNWNRWLPPVQIVKQPDLPSIKFRVLSKDLDKEFEWILIEENGKRYSERIQTSNLTVSNYKYLKNWGTFYELDLPLSLKLNMGYHKFIIRDEFSNQVEMTLIVTPERCYLPEKIKKNQKITLLELNLKEYNNQNDNRIKTFSDLVELINQISTKRVDTIYIKDINDFIPYNGKLFSSNRLSVNPLYLDLNELINFIEDKSIETTLVLKEYLFEIKKYFDGEEKDLTSIYLTKITVLKALYQSFREKHLKKHTTKAKEFINFVEKEGISLKTIALFKALQEYFNKEYEDFAEWHKWPECYHDLSNEVVKLFEKNNKELVEFYQFLQWQAYLQLKKVGITCWENKFNIGLSQNINFSSDINGSECWIDKDLYAFDACFEYNGELQKAPIIPYKLYEFSYKKFITLLRLNMEHFGAINIENLEDYDYLKWRIGLESNEKSFYVKYPFEDLIGIIALESQRNNCAVITKDLKNAPLKIKRAIIQYDIIPEEIIDFVKINEKEDLKNYLLKEEDTTNKLDIQASKHIYSRKIPIATYRLQFNQSFSFNQAKEIISYLKELGISHFYASPLLCARSNSTHGYDIIDHKSLNTFIGSQEEFDQMVEKLHENEMGLIFDLVPNHMAISKENFWWMDVLENGPASEYAFYFDIDWKPLKPELEGKVLVPVLGDHYGNILSNCELKLFFYNDIGKITLNYYEHEFPLNPSSYPLILEYRNEVLETRLGSNNEDFLDYQSIINAFKNLPGHTEKDPEKIKLRNREKIITFKRLSRLCSHNNIISEFIGENLIDYECKPNDPVSCRRLHNLLEEQAYRLAYWRVSVDEINYRRFFDVNDLAGLCIENPIVFSSTHKYILDLIEYRKIDGLRIDHPDGLFNPTEYFNTLQKETGKRTGISFNEDEEIKLCSDNLPFYIIVEKILAPFECLPKNWAVHGTVGYDFLNSVIHLLVDQNAEKKFSKIYQKFINKQIDFQKLYLKCKKIIMKTSLTGELNVLSNSLNKLSEKYYITRDYTLNSIRDALVEIIAHFPVYRTYISEEGRTAKCNDYIKWAVGSAKKQTLSIEPSVFDFIENVLLLEFEKDPESAFYKDILNFAMKFQQYTEPLMAKGLEDTAFYRYNRLVALNEVGGEPKHFGININEFHQANQERLVTTPYSMLSTSTHDTKRSEDVRARICVLSEIPEEWQKKINRWSQLNKSKKLKIDDILCPDKNDEYLFYQTLVGLWPGYSVSEEEKHFLITRIENYMIKAIREAKNHTSWININLQYEEGVINFINKVLTSPEKHPFWKEFYILHQDICISGYNNSLSQTILKLTVPGVPDIYQGNELFKFTLVDPDNRLPVDFTNSRSKLEIIKPLLDKINNNELLDSKLVMEYLLPFEKNTLKLYFTIITLNFRNKYPHLFDKSEYIPLSTTGKNADKIIAFARKVKNEAIIVIVPRLTYNLTGKDNLLPLRKDLWEDTKLIIKPDLKEFESYTNIFTNENYAQLDNIMIGDLFNILSIAILHTKVAVK